MFCSLRLLKVVSAVVAVSLIGGPTNALAYRIAFSSPTDGTLYNSGASFAANGTYNYSWLSWEYAPSYILLQTLDTDYASVVVSVNATLPGYPDFTGTLHAPTGNPPSQVANFRVTVDYYVGMDSVANYFVDPKVKGPAMP